jgi:hypothetical protein
LLVELLSEAAVQQLAEHTTIQSTFEATTLEQCCEATWLTVAHRPVWAGSAVDLEQGEEEQDDGQQQGA